MALAQAWLAAAAMQFQGTVALYVPLPPCVYNCASPDQCLYALTVALLHGLFGAPC